MTNVSVLAGVPILQYTPKPISVAANVRSVVLLDGTSYLPATWSATLNGHGATDDATIALPITGNPDFPYQFFRDAPANATAAQLAAAANPVYVEIWAGFPKDLTPGSMTRQGMKRWFLGIVDLYSAHFDENLVTFTCRNLAATFVDNKITSAPLGMTSVEFVKAMASTIGLTTNIGLPTGYSPITLQEMLGREFIGGANFNAQLANLKPWDIFLKCALFDDVDVWVDQNGVLNYVAPGMVKRSTLHFQYGRDLKAPVGTHSIQPSKNIRVNVHSNTRRTKSSYTVRAEGDSVNGITITTNSRTFSSSPVFGTPTVVAVSTSPTGTSTTTSVASGGNYNASTSVGTESSKEVYDVFVRNVPPMKVQQLAASLWRQYSQQEYGIAFDIPVTPANYQSLDITALFEISQLPYGLFNTKYYPRRLSPRFDPKNGFLVGVEGLNHLLPMGAV